MEEFVNQNQTREETVRQEQVKVALRVYEKQSTFKGAKDTDKWYSATRSDGSSVSVVFKCPVETESKAFEIFNIKGNAKQKTVVKDGETYNNFTYYVQSCNFREIPAEDLPL